MAKLKVAVLMGGPSSEHEVSLLSGKNVVAGLDKAKYEVLPVVVSRSGIWQTEPGELKKRIDVAFIAMHGEFGEDGTVQSILEKEGIVYTGSRPLPSALGMNKIFSSRIFRAHDLPTPDFLAINKNDNWEDLQLDFDLPFIVKPSSRGSSLGVSLVRERKDLGEALKKAFAFGRDALIQKYIYGREVTCGVLDDGRRKITPLLPTEIILKLSIFFDYRSKYANNASEEVTPPRLPEKTIEKIKDTAAAAHRIIGASDISRTDMILSHEDNKLYVLEINTIPGLTPNSLLPKEAAATGISFSELLDKIIQAAINRHGFSH
jgi:D-alanine-D-alanine ligase